MYLLRCRVKYLAGHKMNLGVIRDNFWAPIWVCFAIAIN